MSSRPVQGLQGCAAVRHGSRRCASGRSSTGGRMSCPTAGCRGQQCSSRSARRAHPWTATVLTAGAQMGRCNAPPSCMSRDAILRRVAAVPEGS